MKKYRIIQNSFLFLVIIFYLVILFLMLFFKRPPGSLRSVNIIPFQVIRDLSSSNIVTRVFAPSNLLGNIVLFIPFGVYLTLFNRDKRVLTNLKWISLFSLLAEIIQYIFAIGVSDIDDIILNSIGGLIGIIVYKILLVLFKDMKKVRTIITVFAPVGAIVIYLLLYFFA